MLGNKICVTSKGLDILSQTLQQQTHPITQKLSHHRTGSLPTIKSLEFSKRQMISSKQAQNQKLSTLTRKLELIQKVGIKKLAINKQDRILKELLKKQMKDQQNYLKTIIPNIVKKTRDPNRTNNLDSRFNRSRAYTERLLQNYMTQRKFGIEYNVKRKQIKNNNQQESKGINNNV